MKLTKQQTQQLRELMVAPRSPLPKAVIWVFRVVICGLIALWVVGGIYLNNQVKQDEARIEQARLEAQRRDERLRRTAQYRQELQERSKKPQSTNVFEGR